MRLPSICLDDQLANYLEQFRSCFSKPQYKYFVTILLGLLLCQSGFTLTGILRQVSQDVTLSGIGHRIRPPGGGDHRVACGGGGHRQCRPGSV